MLRSLRVARAVRPVSRSLFAVPTASFAAPAAVEAVSSRVTADTVSQDKPTDIAEAVRIVKAFCVSPYDETLSVRPPSAPSLLVSSCYMNLGRPNTLSPLPLHLTHLFPPSSPFTMPQPTQLALDLNVDPRKPNQMVRGMANVPYGAGKEVVLAVFASGEKAEEARAAGADIVGDDSTIRDILAGKINFTRCVATPDMMRSLAKVARVLGPRGLMPNPKLGTVTLDVRGAVEAARKGQIQYKCDKASWPDAKIVENISAFATALLEAKPSGAKGIFYNTAYLSSTMGVSKTIDTRSGPFRPPQ